MGLICFDPFPYAGDIAVISGISSVEKMPLVSKFGIFKFRDEVLQCFDHLIRQFVRSRFDRHANVLLQRGSFGHALFNRHFDEALEWVRDERERVEIYLMGFRNVISLLPV